MKRWENLAWERTFAKIKVISDAEDIVTLDITTLENVDKYFYILGA